MAGRIRLDWDAKGMSALMVSRDMAAMTRAAAVAGMAYAKSISPRSKKQHQHYQGSFVVLKAKFNDPLGGVRVGAILANRADHAGAVEWGTDLDGRKPQAGHNVLARTVSHIEGIS